MLIAGIDEAGRGCVIGPLVVAGILVKEENLSALLELGVKDSKLLPAKKRELLVPAILKLVEKQAIVKVSPQEIDRVVNSQRRLHKLNRLEAESMAQIVDKLEPSLVYVDAADVLERRFGEQISESVKVKTRIISKHKADQTYPIVSAASIIAKVERDKEVSQLRIRYGDFGSGYLTDPKTLIFLQEWMKTHSEYPEWVRKSWKPAKRVKSAKGTTQLKLI
jgi:ribonuclease HII